MISKTRFPRLTKHKTRNGIIAAALIIVIAVGVVITVTHHHTSRVALRRPSGTGSSSVPITLNQQELDNLQIAEKSEEPSTPPAPKVLLDISGNGSNQTQAFTTNGNWTATYTYDCSNIGGSGNFQFYIKNPDGTLSSDAGANELAASGGNTDYYYDSGEHYLLINSECNWHVTVKG